MADLLKYFKTKPDKKVTELLSRYSAVPILAGRYQVITVNNNVEPNPNVIHLPYIMADISFKRSVKADFKYDKFMYTYNNLHKCCPKCGYEQYTSTLSGYALNLSKPEEYKNSNRCTCIECKDCHTVHDRVPKN